MPFVRTNGISMYYEVHGEGEPVVLIGGLGSQTQSWATQAPLYSANYKVIVFDNRGAGRTDKPDEPYSLEQMAEDTIGLMDALDIERAHVVGKSMGGMIGQWLGIKHPDRVNSLVLGCTAASRDEIGNEILRFGRETAEKQGLKSLWLGALFWGYTREYIENNYAQVRNSIDMIKESPEALAGYIRQNYACKAHDTAKLVGSITAPTLVMYGERDLIVAPRRSRQLAELIPNSKLIEFKDVGHGFWRERQEEVDKCVLEFLSG